MDGGGVDRGPAAEAAILRSLLDNLDVVVWAVDSEGYMRFHDGRAARSEGDLTGKNVHDLYTPEVNVWLNRALQGEAHRKITEPTPGHFWESWYTPVKDENGVVTGVIGMSIDVSEAQKAQRELSQKLEVIERQQDVIRNLETPVLEVWEGVIALPLVGIIDSSRAARVMNDLLSAVSRTNARFVLLDLTGVDVVDTATANYLIGMVRAIGLLGACGVVTGIRPNVAQTIVSIGMDLSSLKTLGTLRQGLSYCIRQMATQKKEPAF
ncbi:STAS domain-containing protein [Polyangium sorediatum]|uniref:PAS domain-containing protein n=1 Tax=Polyangium sorediatum TaxID=889274 RepID=A0ABT6NNA0_9BACT|nr:STAS domain-containing protein [Polyangium sorediatum]MDI1429806.1 PAS domain-containing protein [Polyangium sorediatum]